MRGVRRIIEVMIRKKLVFRSIFFGAIATIGSLLFLLIVFWLENYHEYDGFLSTISRLLNCPGFLAVWFGPFAGNFKYLVYGLVNWLCWTLVWILILIPVWHFRNKRSLQ